MPRSFLSLAFIASSVFRDSVTSIKMIVTPFVPSSKTDGMNLMIKKYSSFFFL